MKMNKLIMSVEEADVRRIHPPGGEGEGEVSLSTCTSTLMAIYRH